MTMNNKAYNDKAYNDKNFDEEMNNLYKELFSAESILKSAKQNYKDVNKETEEKLKELLKRIGD